MQAIPLQSQRKLILLLKDYSFYSDTVGFTIFNPQTIKSRYIR